MSVVDEKALGLDLKTKKKTSTKKSSSSAEKTDKPEKKTKSKSSEDKGVESEELQLILDNAVSSNLKRV